MATIAKQQVQHLCNQLMNINPAQIVIDLVQENIEEILNDDDVTPDAIGAECYHCSILREVYNPDYDTDIQYLLDLEIALRKWSDDAEFANKSLGLDPNE
jgi:hypothetical protein